MADKEAIIMVTGANKSLGYLVTQQLAGTGRYHIILACRDTSKADEAIKKLVADSSIPNQASSFSTVQLDSTNDKSIAAAAEEIKSRFGKLDILMNNAGIQGPQSGSVLPAGDGKPTLREAFAEQFNTNVFGSECVTEAFLPLLRASKYQDRRIVYTTSGLGSLGDGVNDDSMYPIAKYGYPIYRSSKTAVNMVAMCRAVELGKEGITVTVVDPGFCATDFNGKHGPRDPKDGAAAIVSGVLNDKSAVHRKFLGTETASGIIPW